MMRHIPDSVPVAVGEKRLSTAKLFLGSDLRLRARQYVVLVSEQRPWGQYKSGLESWLTP
jgi:hypothetical protein